MPSGRFVFSGHESFFCKTYDSIGNGDGNSFSFSDNSVLTKNLDDLLIPAEAQDEIRNLESSLGHFPIFAAIKAYLGGLENEERAIIDGCLLVFEGQDLQNIEDVATSLGISYGQLRLRRNKIFRNLHQHFASYYTLGFVGECPYNYQMCRINEEINATEGCEFNLNFVNWVLATTFPEITLLGDVAKSLTNRPEKNHYICLVPTNLCQYMDFGDFVEDIDARLAEKRTEEERISLQGLINSHLKIQYCEDEMYAIETSCRSILYIHSPLEVDYGHIIFKPNVRKKTPIIIEDILRSFGHPMALEELYEEFILQYPERYIELNSFRSILSRNRNIKPIRRKSVFSLCEWEKDEKNSYNIISFAQKYLKTSRGHIAPFQDVCSFLRQSYPHITDGGIITNLLGEKTEKGFSLYLKDKVLYLGYGDKNYGDSFIIIYSGRYKKRVLRERMEILIKFCKTHGHFPFNNRDNKEEIQLYEFVRNRREDCAHYLIPAEEIEEWMIFEERYQEYDIPRPRKSRNR